LLAYRPTASIVNHPCRRTPRTEFSVWTGRFGVDTFGIGEDSGQPVTFDYKPPFKFTGTIEKVTIKVK
jgi:hypothetical protein